MHHVVSTAASTATHTDHHTSTGSRLFSFSSPSVKPVVSSNPAPSSFLAKMHNFPLFGANWGSKEVDASGLAERERRFSFGKPKTRLAQSPPSAHAPPLKRSKSARTSLIASARRLSTSHKRDKDFPPISRPALVERNGLEEGNSSALHDYRARAAAFAMSSPELATPHEEDGQWAPWGGMAAEVEQPPTSSPPLSPMVKWAGDAKNGASSFVPLSPRPFSASSSTPSADFFHHASEASTEESTGPDTPEPSSSPVFPSQFKRARSPVARWNPPILPSPPPTSPPVAISRARSRSPPIVDPEREAARAEALAKLTSPTPTASKFPDHLASFPFPAMEHEAAATQRPPRPTRPLPALPGSGTTHSLILPLPSARNTLLPEEPLTPPALTRSNTVGLHPSPVPLDIDFKGRLVRARNSHPSNNSPHLTLSSNGSFGAASSPGSGFSDWSRPVGSRKSSETSFSTSVEHEEQATPIKGGLYALANDRRLIESAVDVLEAVEEDEPPLSMAPAVRVKRSPSKQGGSPARRTSAAKKRISLDSSLPSNSSGDVVVVPRSRARPPSSASPAKPIRPYLLNESNRAFSSGVVVEPTRDEREQLGIASSSTSSVSFLFPTPSGLPGAASPPRQNSPSRPRAGKRCLSELHVEDRPVSPEREKLYGLGLGLPSALGGGRTRHESFALDSDDAPSGEMRPRATSRRLSSGAPTRTKLVLREKGKPTLTYQLGECIGRGQFGSVYRALNLNTGQVVAVKRIQLEGKTDSEINQLSNEVTLLQRLTHPSVVKYEGIVRTEHYLNIILEYVENGSLEKTIKQFGQAGHLPENLVASYVVKILEGLAYLHAQDVVHCDLKAANILSTKNGNVKLSDFGVSLNLQAIKATRGINAGANEVNGTPNWMAPEVIELSGASSASDIWSFGATICELIDGKPPYADLVAMSAMFHIVTDETPPIPDRCSAELKSFLQRCFRKNPAERPAAKELFEDPWLLKFWDPCKDMRPQDSLPFLRRISTEYRRPTLNLPPSVDPILDSDETIFAASPLPLQPPVLPFAQDEPRGRESLDSGYRAGDERADTPEAAAEHAVEDAPRQHNFVKTTFSKAIECRLCGEHTKRHAVLCRSCGLISHARCKEFAGVCDLRAQLLNPQPSRYPLSPLSSAAPTLNPLPSSFNLTSYLPFGKPRRGKASAPTPAVSSAPEHEPAVAFTPVHATQSRTSGAIRHLSNALKPTRTRTPEHTPPSSLSATTGNRLGGRPHSQSVSAAARAANASETSLDGPSSGPAGRVSFDTTAPPQLHRVASPLGLNVVQTQGGARALARKKSHSRSVSVPVAAPTKPAKDGDCVVM
ncbi:hypothetical protein JCM10207_005172 [Rhodosporidiobolus poonsookiae]